MSRKVSQIKNKFGGLNKYSFKILVGYLMGRVLCPDQGHKRFFSLTYEGKVVAKVHANAVNVLFAKGYIKKFENQIYITKTGHNLVQEKLEGIGGIAYEGSRVLIV